MYSSNNSSWTSSIYAQDAGDTNWYQYSLKIVGTPKKYTVNTQNTTATSLSTYDGYDLASGQFLTLSSDGSTWSNAALGVGTTVSPLFPTPELSVSLSSNSNTIFANTGTAFANPVYVKPDGSKLWKINSGNLIEYTLSNSWNLITATASGKTIGSFTSANSSPSAFTFGKNGKYLIKVVAGYVYQYSLATPWDISTVSSNAISVTASTLNNESGSSLSGYGRYLKFSPDGTKMFYMYNPANGTSHGYTYTLSAPWVVGTVSSSATSNTGRLAAGVGSTAFVGGTHLSDDGRTLIVLRNDGTVGGPTSNIVVFNITTAWNVATKAQIGSSYNLTTSSYNFTDAPQNASMYLIATPDGQKITTSWGALNSFQTFTTKTNTEYNFDISSHALGSAPTYAFRPFANAYAQVANTSSYINFSPREISMINSAPAAAYVTANSSNTILTPGNILVNGTSIVALTSATQMGANNSIPGSRIATGSRFLKYYGKNVGLPDGWTRSNIYNFKMSTDGYKVYIFGTNGNLFPSTSISGYKSVWGIAQYDLNVPFDITTIRLSGTFRPRMGDTNNVPNSMDIDPTGTYMTLGYYTEGGIVGYWFKEYILSTAGDIETAAENGILYKTPNPSYGLTAHRGRFAPNGLSFHLQYSYSNGYETRYAMSYCTTSVPFRLLSGSSSSFTTVFDGNGAYSSGVVSTATWAPNGLSILFSDSSRTAEHTAAVSTPFYYTAMSTTGANSWYTVTQTSGTEGCVTWPAPGIANTGSYATEYSADGNFVYMVHGSTDFVYQFSTKAANTTQYFIEFTTQSGSPNTISIPDRSIPLSLTPTLYANGTVLLTSANVANNGRVIATRLDSVYEGTSIDSLTINLWKQ